MYRVALDGKERMNLYDEIRKLQQKVIEVQFDASTLLVSEPIREIQRRARLGQAINESHDAHIVRCLTGFDPRQN